MTTGVEQENWKRLADSDYPIYAITGSKQRWFWVVWENYSKLYETEPVAHGYAQTRKLAIQAAAEAVKADVNDCRCYLSHVAADWRKVINQRKRQPKTGTREASSIEFVYLIDWYDPDWGERYRTVTPHRIIKRTAKFVFVAAEPYREGYTDTRTCVDTEIITTFRLDREALERGEGVRHPRSFWRGNFYFDSNAESDRERDFPWHLKPHLEKLDLSWPCSLTEVKKAYRRKSCETHPDSGGAHKDFIAVRESYEQLTNHLNLNDGRCL